MIALVFPGVSGKTLIGFMKQKDPDAEILESRPEDTNVCTRIDGVESINPLRQRRNAENLKQTNSCPYAKIHTVQRCRKTNRSEKEEYF